MGNGLYLFRHSKRLSQSAMAEKIGCSRATYSSYEKSKSDAGTMTFWLKVQRAFGLSDAELIQLMKVEAN